MDFDPVEDESNNAPFLGELVRFEGILNTLRQLKILSRVGNPSMKSRDSVDRPLISEFSRPASVYVVKQGSCPTSNHHFEEKITANVKKGYLKIQ
jgi:hypothetical protein